jgi:hypothetical protein
VSSQVGGGNHVAHVLFVHPRVTRESRRVQRRAAASVAVTGRRGGRADAVGGRRGGRADAVGGSR